MTPRHNPLNESDLNPDGVGAQTIKLYNRFAVQGDPQNYWWLSFANKHGNVACLLTQDQEAGELFKLMDRITAAGLNPGSPDVAVFCVTATGLMETGDAWMLEKCDVLVPAKTMQANGSASIRL